MKQLVQNYKTGKIELEEIPVPQIGSEQVLVKTINSVISIGSEKKISSFAKESLFKKAKSRPDLLKQVISKALKEGFLNTYKLAMNRLDEPLPLGYSSAGRIVQIGDQVQNLQINDRVAIFGTRNAPHAEYTAVPAKIVVKIPDQVDFQSAAFISLGAVAINGINNAKLEPESQVAVIGLGMIGFLTALILKSKGYKVTVFDISEKKLALAKQMGINNCFKPDVDSIEQKTLEITGHKGFNRVIITASTNSNQPIELAINILRFQGRIVLVGVVGLDISRQPFYKKEAEFVVSKDAGLGQQQQINMQEFLEFLKNKKFNIKQLITHQIDIDNIARFYTELINNQTSQTPLGVVVNYNNATKINSVANINALQATTTANKSKKINIGIIGTGQFARNVFLPILFKNKNIYLKGISSSHGVSSQQFGKKYNAEYITTNYNELLEDNNIDAVFVLTQHSLHAEMVLNALKHNKHVFVEKPLCINETELQQIKNAYLSQKHNCKQPVLMVGFNRRFSPFSQKIKQFLDKQGSVSKVITIRSNAGYIPANHWTQDPNIGGGRIIGEICHYIDLVNYFTDSYPTSVYAIVKSNSIQNDNLIINLEYQDGSIASICYCANGNKAYPRERVEIFSNNSVCIINDFKSIEIAHDNKIRQHKNLNRDMGYHQEINNFLMNIQNNSINEDEFKKYLITTQTTFKILESINSKQKIKINFPTYET